ncbi:MAG: UDP-glucose/GDP-mannose dehydrogenase family protein [Chloroflexi bacterium]|nr:UDP-glucose/GDP-mannose dehydrogenase family protein [Chloroflexota bacterium]
MTSNLCVIGVGRSGAVTAAGLADMGHRVRAVDIDAGRVAELNGGKAPFFEPGLDEMIARNLESGRISFTTELCEAVPNADAVLLCVPTPAGSNGDADLSMLYAALRDVGPLLKSGALVITRSTVPVGTNALLAIQLHQEHPDLEVAVISNPEFLREGHAVDDFMRPERIIIGAADAHGGSSAAKLYESLDCPIIITDLETAEITKYAANAYLAASISFINEIANICERTGADVTKVTEALHLDRRIGEHAYIEPGIGFGGSCLPKDLSALVSTAEGHGYEPTLLKAIMQVNNAQPRRIVSYLEEFFKDLSSLKVAVLGISFKGDTFDVRSSPAMSVIRHLGDAGVRVQAFDPMADRTVEMCVSAIAELHEDAYSAATGCDAIVIASEHSEFRTLDLQRLGKVMASRVLIDGRNLLDPATVAEAGFSYIGIGRARRGD